MEKERRYDARMKKLYNAIKICEDNIKEVKTFNKKISEFGNGNNEICECIENSNIQICSKIKRIAEETSIKTNQITYAQ